MTVSKLGQSPLQKVGVDPERQSQSGHWSVKIMAKGITLTQACTIREPNPCNGKESICTSH